MVRLRIVEEWTTQLAYLIVLGIAMIIFLVADLNREYALHPVALARFQSRTPG
jgi:hypothetical protein